jgi:hypothetical protein
MNTTKQVMENMEYVHRLLEEKRFPGSGCVFYPPSDRVARKRWK